MLGIVFIYQAIVAPLNIAHRRATRYFGPVLGAWDNLLWLAFLGLFGWLAFAHSTELRTDLVKFFEHLPGLFEELKTWFNSLEK